MTGSVGEHCVLGSQAEARLNSATESVGLIGDGSLLGNVASAPEVGDALYGVTMRGYGVATVIS